MKTLIKNGLLYTPDGAREGDLVIQDGKIAAVETPGTVSGDIETIDAKGLPVLPGMIDMHVHIDDKIGGIQLADTFATAGKAAIMNGITTLVGFSTQEKNESLMERMHISINKGIGKSHCDYSFHFTPTRFQEKDWQDIEHLAKCGFRTMKLYTTYREAGLYTNRESMREIMCRCRKLDIRILVHCESQSVLDTTNWDNMNVSNPATHSLARPEAAETTAVENVISLSKETGAMVHIVHVSSDRTAALLATVRGDGSITCETAPHYLLLNNNKLAEKNGHRFLCTPPLRNEKTREMMVNAAFSGDIDLFATDHCAFLRKDKDLSCKDYRKIPMGLAGVGSLVPAIYELMVKKHGKSLADLATRLSLNPAKVTGLFPRKGSLLPGADADIVILNQEGPKRSMVSTFADSYETFPDRTTLLEIVTVMLRGNIVVQNGEIVSENEPTGECIWSLN